jgi:copper(I)-binding protein
MTFIKSERMSFVIKSNQAVKVIIPRRHVLNRFFIALATAFMLVTSAAAHDYTLGDIHIMKPWSRPLPAVSVNGAAYMTLTNTGNAPDRLVSVTTPAASKAELHNHIMEGGLMKMRPAGAVEIAPGHPTMLQPGGLHVMLMGLTEPLVAGNAFPLTLNFERAGSIDVKVMIFEPEETGHGHMKHNQKKTGG